MSVRHPALARAESFAATYGLRRALLLAPMAGACPPALSVAVMRAGGLGACGALLMQPAAILAWAEAVREAGPFQINLWIPDPAPVRDPAHEARLRGFLGRFGPAVPPEAGDAAPPDFAAQCEAMIEARPRIVSSIMGLYPPDFVARLKECGIAWWATVSTVAEALAAQDAGADAVVAQGAEAGGHRGCFRADQAEAGAVGLMALLPAVVDAVRIPVIATGGIADARGAAAALLLGASAVQVGTGFLRCPEAGIPPAWADALGGARPEDTRLTRAFSGRTGRSLATEYVAAAAGPDAPVPAPYPVQRGLTQGMREAAVKEGDLARMQAWAGQAAGLARAVPAGEVVGGIWEGVDELLR
ncbi:NAD(P)H-dependent flavin oxidoreductase [Methylobacterium frigidaeris]|uniref:Propionate 3-nitronate monooxygenase n=1 Tax=Methylobacterium frigidaeris TaxID=2038277 RepID=A0AA37M6W8_9HYPH|nr:nitronate monooxygenase [Methylobacterium frigidaeris]PIK70695.1 nitronate monooxygenase [Methylobacterium frigidaeris]GJD64151.1 Nitronate monooxygenase [Methylobacterium frigidaeris]